MTSRPGRVFTELAIDAPYPRDERFRTSAEYAAFCRRRPNALAQASREGRHGVSAAPIPPNEAAARERLDGVLRALLPVAMLALDAVRLGFRGARTTTSRPMCCPDRGWSSIR